MTIYYVGSSVRFSVAITDIDDTLIDPTGLSFILNSPTTEGLISYEYGVDGELVKDSTGNYHVDYVLPVPFGDWDWKWEATGTGAGVDRGDFVVTR